MRWVKMTQQILSVSESHNETPQKESSYLNITEDVIINSYIYT